MDADSLERRIAANASGFDLSKWIFGRVDVAGKSVLELCCGTGAQTRHMLKNGANVLALDASMEALKRLKESGAKTIHARMEELNPHFWGLQKFDLVFCAYGLYYSKWALGTLDACRAALAPGGRIVIVGPYGQNNERLFGFLQQCGVMIPPKAYYASHLFMEEVVLHWANQNFGEVIIHTTKNFITWDKPELFMDYWEHSTFYDESRAEEVRKRLAVPFVNGKQIMLVEMKNART